MTTLDHRPFMAAILADPSDDAPRLVYADALEDVGECDHSEFIRVQCELARLEDCGERTQSGIAGGVRAGCRCCILRRRERELLLNHWWRWIESLPRIGWHCGNIDTNLNQHVAPAVWFSRGFVASVRLTLATWTGGECWRCGGHGRVPDPDLAGTCDADNLYADCPVCHGGGRFLALGPALALACPLDRDAGVRFTDREPGRGDLRRGDLPGVFWQRLSTNVSAWPGPNPRQRRYSLSDDLFEMVEGDEDPMSHAKTFDSPDLAHAAASRSAIAWALAQPAEVPT